VPHVVVRAVRRVVRVGRLGGDAAVRPDELEGVLHEPALAPVVLCFADLSCVVLLELIFVLDARRAIEFCGVVKC
jgi:hypothetical protein